jgi:hypothetical protein
MHRPGESFLQFVWKHRLLKSGPWKSASGCLVELLHPGDQNSNAGPDFTNARLRIGSIELAGNVEIHVRTSDWLRHGHDGDRGYDKIILHVVYDHDAELDQNRQFGVDVLEIKELVSKQVLERYESFRSVRPGIACSAHLPFFDPSIFSIWLSRMSVERLQRRFEITENIHQAMACSYPATFYVLLLRASGAPVNGAPFELIARQLPLNILLRHSDNLLQLEALLLGMANLLTASDHARSGQIEEFAFLKRKYALETIPEKMVKRSKMRPSHAPALRLLQFARLMHMRRELFMHPDLYRSYDEIFSALRPATVNSDSNGLHQQGVQFTNSLIINGFVPFFFYYGRKTSQSSYAELALNLLSRCRSETNHKTAHFNAATQNVSTALESQGMIHLYDAYCTKKRCLECGVGTAILGRKTEDVKPTWASALPTY